MEMAGSVINNKFLDRRPRHLLYQMDPNIRHTPVSDRVPVSIFERLIPSIAFVLAAISGGIGGMLIENFLSVTRTGEIVGMDTFFIRLAHINAVIGGLLTMAALVGSIGLLISLIRMFTKNTRSSPPGILLFLVGSLSMVPGLLVGIGIYLIILSVSGPVIAGVSTVASVVWILDVAAIAVSCLMVIVLGAFSFVSFSSRAGRKYSAFIFLLLLDAGIVAAAALFFSVVQYSLAHTNLPFWR